MVSVGFPSQRAPLDLFGIKTMIKKEMMFTFVADGTPMEFAAFKSVICPFDKKKKYQIDIYRELVAFRNSPTVYIIDNTGNILSR